MGAYEFNDCNCNDIDDEAELSGSTDCDDNRILDECEAAIAGPDGLARDPIAIIPLEAVDMSDLQLDQNWMIVGSASDSLLTNAGAVYFYRWNAPYWYGPARKTSSNSQSFNEFGTSVGISGGWAVAGAPGADSPAGEANVFKLNTGNNTWSEFGNLLESSTGINVGAVVAIHDDVIAVSGASDSAVSGSSSGLVYVFHYNATAQAWQLKDTMVPSDGNAVYFGISVAVRDDWIAVGYSVDESGLPAGVEMFHYDGTDWDEDDLLDYPGAPAQDDSGFGMSLAMDEDVLVAGAVGYGAGAGNGEAYVSLLDGVWAHVETLDVNGVDADDLFGRDVDIWRDMTDDETIVVVGAPLQESNDSGAAHFFLLNECLGEMFHHELLPASPTSNGNFGHPVSHYDDVGIVRDPRAQSSDMLNDYRVLGPCD